MKKNSAVMTIAIFLLMSTFATYAQTTTKGKLKAIEPYQLTVGYTKTTNIIFPFAIVSVDRGSKDLLAQKANGIENILQVKAAKERFQQTNLTVITSDGKLTSFVIDYADQPSVLNLAIGADDRKNAFSILSENINQKELQEYARIAVTAGDKIRTIRDKAFGMSLDLNGLFINDDFMYLRVKVTNNTYINYDIDQFRLYIRDQKKVKRTATQELEVFPVFVYNEIERVKGDAENTCIVVVPKFTVPDKKYFVIQLMEKNGGRNLELHVRNNTLIKAVPIH